MKYFQPKRNIIFNRSLFNDCRQKPGQRVEEFISDCYRLIRDCEYNEDAAALQDNLLRDRIAVGVADKHLRDQLTFDNELTLEKALNTIRAWSLKQDQSQELNARAPAQEPLHADAVQRKTRPRKHEKPEEKRRVKTCFRCGREPHMKHDCPAWGKTCSKCKLKNHFAECCRTQRVHNIDDEENQEELQFCFCSF